ncbi:hypothetical protein SNK03_003964 [Fusarium graminearum]|uniref:Chromosome 1, complete genome n=2 Tax=Gibberella zeae TaxID=5518 RepID=I1S1E3_GIBZE|nr:hypothetical protein FGSG_10543 [Fusarium graminearum PH-1]EYB33342.1 hypothetical protein FG05_10543 [Fusarium graminearum]ESU17278.1 hypothetical protein FGSG_10543 [Fusarium graminearum PH-1]KAI6763344.1 hypothetical protein HG531_013241 [Fusarium graminearum]PCD24168.1 hypothetical protein FGRA07_11370 [Fusarium graminearum]CAF3522623.1 unnamed protein product [Fusarium graminearum]|eukprot:XP_011319540.1 hypothetical protein FGSG_10543 [Fusarium graminearum PH-1]
MLSLAKILVFTSFLFETALCDRFYYGSGCTGDYKAFSASQYEKCYKTPEGYARSIWSDTSSGVNEWWTAYRRRQGGAVCGYSVCSFNALNSHCCSASGKFISGLIVHRPGRTQMASKEKTGVEESLVRDPEAATRAFLKLSPEEQAAAAHTGGPPVGADITGTKWEPKECEEIGGPDAQSFIELPDGTHHGLGAGVLQVSEQELQRQLKAKGKPALSDKRIAELRENGFLE